MHYAQPIIAARSLPGLLDGSKKYWIGRSSALPRLREGGCGWDWTRGVAGCSQPGGQAWQAPVSHLAAAPANEGLGFLPVQLARARPLLGNSRQRWDEPHQARARRAPPGRPTEPRPRPPPDALTQPPAWRGAQLGVLTPPGGCWSPRLPPQPGWSLRVPRCAGGWRGARDARPPRCSPAQESGPVQVVIRMFGSGCCCAQVCRAAAAPFAAYRL